MSSCPECTPEQMCVECWDRSIDEDTTIPQPEVVYKTTQVLRDRSSAWKKANPEKARSWEKKNRVRINLRRNERRRLRKGLENHS